MSAGCPQGGLGCGAGCGLNIRRCPWPGEGSGCIGAELLPLQDYMDPMNEFSALNEAKQMIAIADENQNHYLEPEEVLKYSEFFTGSKLVDYARSVHEEF